MSRRLQSVRPTRRRAAPIAAATAAFAGEGAFGSVAAGAGSAAEGPWLFVTVAFVACAVAFFAWGWLLGRLRRRDGPVAPETAAAALEAARAGGSTSLRFDAQEVVDAMAGVAFVAERQPQGLALAALNAPARALWPHAGAGSPLETLAGLSPASRGALESLRPAQATTFDGWRLAMLSGPAGAPPRYLLMQVAGGATEGDIFGSTLSHDLRAPVRVVEGFTRIVKEDYGTHLDRIGNEHLDRVLGAAARMNLMIDALLTMARLSAQPLARQPVDLSQIAHFVVDDLRRGNAARAVQVEIEPDLAASGDPTLLRLVLENLLGNAWKYTARTEAARIAVRAAVHGGERAFQVSDNGAGFDMRSAERLFGLFQRLHSANDFPGHGVGLASVRRIVRRHGGDIWAEGRPGQGATFTFTLG
ncbi:MAG: GHKL domain-containing protein [Rubrivivax sp.]|nr:GHKL domain-containing protein [Rubrivivax sp.]